MKTTDPDACRGCTGAHSGRMRRPRWTTVSAIAILAIAAIAAGASDQNPKDSYAIIYGTVWGADNRPATGVIVKIQRQGDKKPKWERTSDRRGEFAVRVPVEAADYTLFVDAKGKKRAETKVHVEGDVHQVVQFDVTLHLGD